ncbi:hypothetical protein ASPWEDRAFT_176848 [Aspergillus wentii DTO 134E9]|uniref:Uncharacterized protein n=1 Tax=Aspergillus wentii DTO 134E9 TaxID=1073089 RepID=A0A1L9R5L5_ASPWE|nr:uncharacterized protein ASPWEDRAFT_176848 [Aspergillus wentii DTO 134E9]KAI9925325.1 hypothetical protein MW887_006253 [Aspergillus wentii]OJJ30177.1 hypothetical protein ASPWEDRAFT_176848 [Aspergillus wentii DTO 134E9]
MFNLSKTLSFRLWQYLATSYGILLASSSSSPSFPLATSPQPLPHLQFACAAASIVDFMPTATCLAMLTFRDYGPQLTQLINDAMWMTLFRPWPTFWLQWWTISWAVLGDKSPDPIFPK